MLKCWLILYSTELICIFMGSILNNKQSTATVVYVLLLVLLTLRIGGAVSHYCFDGLEPAVTVHFDNLNGHVEHEAELGHTDVEKQVLSDNLLGKIFELESMLVILAMFLIAPLSQSAGQGYLHRAVLQLRDPKNYRPPLRAPPLTS